MLEIFYDGFQSLHFNTLTLSPTRVNWVERQLMVGIISFKRPTMWLSFTRDGKTQLGGRAMVCRNV
jgi:hypothetical protein